MDRDYLVVLIIYLGGLIGYFCSLLGDGSWVVIKHISNTSGYNCLSLALLLISIICAVLVAVSFSRKKGWYRKKVFIPTAATFIIAIVILGSFHVVAFSALKNILKFF